MLIAARRLFRADTFAPGWLRVEDGRIATVGDGAPDRDPDVRLDAGYLIPGLVDVHCHGGGASAFGTSDPDDVERALMTHRRHGTTTVIASLVTGSPQTLTEQMDVLRPWVEQGEIAGVHLEGPWLAPAQRGAHDQSLLVDPSPESVAALVDAGGGTVRMVTIAPELPGAPDSIRFLVERGVVVAVGHTAASLDETRRGIADGATGATHLFNAMPALHHRSPGPILALCDSRAFLELIVDGVHVHPALAAHLIGAYPDRIVLITDAMAAAGAPDGDYVLGSLPVSVIDGIARLTGTQTIAGSTLTLDAALRNAVDAGVPLANAVRAATSNPAAYLHLSDVGQFASGYRADAVVLNDDLEVARVLRHGGWISPHSG